MARYFIHETNIEKVEDRISKIEKKCKKFGCTFNYERVGEEFRNVSDILDYPNIQKFIEIEVEGVAVINNWELVAKIEHESGGCIISKIDFDAQIPQKYIFSDYCVCEHCNSNRHRKVVYILRNTQTGESKQVGSSCLKNFTGALDAENAARYFSMFDELVENDGLYIAGSASPYYNIKDYLRYCVECVDKFGWCNSSSEYPTANRAWDYFTYKEFGRSVIRKASELEDEMKTVNFDASEEHHGAKVDSIIEFVNNMEDDSSYVISIKSLANSYYFNSKFKGFVASMVICYNKEVERKEAAQNNPSKFVGNIGDKLEAEFNKFEVVASWEGQYGSTWVYKFVTTDGNILIWKSSKWISSNKTKKGHVKFTVKDHTEFRGIHQTEVTRCRISA